MRSLSDVLRGGGGGAVTIDPTLLSVLCYWQRGENRSFPQENLTFPRNQINQVRIVLFKSDLNLRLPLIPFVFTFVKSAL